MIDPSYEPIADQTKQILQRFTSRSAPPPPPPPGIGKDMGQDDNDGMNAARILKLEEFADDAKQRLVRFETKIDHIEKEVSQVKWLIVVQILAGIATVAGTGIAIQQMTVSTFQAAGAQQVAPTHQQPIIIQMPQAAPATAAPPAN